MTAIGDPEVQALATFAATLHAEYAADDVAWQGSPFAWIKTRPSRQVGTIGERLVAGWLASKEFDVVRSPDSDADRLVNGHRVEIKFSTMWRDGFYKFQQLRDQNYELAICLGISPFDAHCWAIPKSEIMKRWKASPEDRRDVGGIQSQHGGSGGKDTAWLHVDIDYPPPWLGAFGGRLSDAAKVVARLAARR